MKLGTIGYNYSHEDTFLMDRPEGTGCGVMLLVKTPTRFNISISLSLSAINPRLIKRSACLSNVRCSFVYSAIEPPMKKRARGP